MAIAIQLRGKDQVLEAYENMDVPVWAIFQYKSLTTKGEGVEMLTKFLDLLSINATGGIYTLKTYEDLTDPKQVKEKTEASGSLNFRLGAADFENDNSPVYQDRQLNRRLYLEIDELKRRLDEKEIEEPEPQSFEQAAIGLLNSPAELASLVLAFKELFSNKPAAQNTPAYYQEPVYKPSAINGVNTEEMRTTELTAEDHQKLETALATLIEKDKKLPQHLEKLAEIAEKNPGKFKMLLLMLENY